MKKVLISMLVVVSLLLAVSCSSSYTVAFNTMGGTPEKFTTQNVAAGGVATQPTPDPVKYGYKFTGWYTDSACTNAWSFTTKVTTNMTLYAGWQNDPESITYTVKFVLNGGSPTNVKDQVVVNGKYATDPEVALGECIYRGDQRVAGWFTTPSFLPGTKWNFASSKVTKDEILYACYGDEVPEEYFTVKFDAKGGVPEPGVQLVEKDGTPGYPTNKPSKVGFIFTGWYTDESCTVKAPVTGSDPNLSFSFTVDSDMTLYAGYESKISGKYVVAYSVYDSFETVPVVYAEFGDKVAVPTTTITPKTGYDFDYWYIIKTAEGKEIEVPLVSDGTNFVGLYVEDDLVVYAKFKRQAKVVVSFNTNGGSPVPTNQTSYDSSTETGRVFVKLSGDTSSVVYPNAVEKTGYELDGWYTESTFVNEVVAGQEFTSDAILYAKWIADEPTEADYFTYNYDKTEITGWTTIGKAAMEGDSTATPAVAPIDNLRIPEGIKKVSGLIANATGDAESTGVAINYKLMAVAYVQIPSTLTEIGDYAFRDWVTLEKVSTEKFNPTILKASTVVEPILEVPAQVTKVGTNAFKGCTLIRTLVLGDGVKELPASLVTNVDTIYADGAVKIGTVFGESNVTGKTLFARSVVDAEQLKTLDGSSKAGGGITVYVNANYVANDPYNPTTISNLKTIRDTTSLVITVKTADELKTALNVTGATVKLDGTSLKDGKFVLSASGDTVAAGDGSPLKIAKGVTLDGSGIIDFSGITIDMYDDSGNTLDERTFIYKGLLKLASTSDITFVVNANVATTQSGLLWYLAQVEGACIDICDKAVSAGSYTPDYVFAYTGTESGVDPDVDRTTLKIGKLVTIGAADEDHPVSLCFATNNTVSGAENLSGALDSDEENELTIIAKPGSAATDYSELSEVVKASFVNVKVSAATTVDADFNVKGDGIVLDLTNITDFAKADVDGAGFVAKLPANDTASPAASSELVKNIISLLASDYPVTIDASAFVAESSGEGVQVVIPISGGEVVTKPTTVDIPKAKKLIGTRSALAVAGKKDLALEFGGYLTITHAENLTIDDEVALVAAKANIITSLLNVGGAYVEVKAGQTGIVFNNDLTVGTKANSVTLDMSGSTPVSFGNNTSTGKSFVMSIGGESTVLVGQKSFIPVLSLGSLVGSEKGILKLGSDVNMTDANGYIEAGDNKDAQGNFLPFTGTLYLNGNTLTNAVLANSATIVGDTDSGLNSGEDAKGGALVGAVVYYNTTSSTVPTVTLKNVYVYYADSSVTTYKIQVGAALIKNKDADPMEYKYYLGNLLLDNCYCNSDVLVGHAYDSQAMPIASDGCKVAFKNGHAEKLIDIAYRPAPSGSINNTSLTFTNTEVQGTQVSSVYNLFVASGAGIAPILVTDSGASSGGYYSDKQSGFAAYSINNTGLFSVNGTVKLKKKV